ncbi:Protein CBG11803 [Caenorhabditis briggsae]|uniref:Protein CBG11803 n=1 Tax=Caenorhabditis briggsae TaxID=6238 RepID=A8XE28_CAEBR|nr:Protein CBG11803 [Caenorhabditis briggsae]CAP30899.1 Protein CBG11803 [Caenorhabditis briggsae]
MDQRRKSFKTVYNGSDENRVQTPETANTSNVRTVTNTLKQPNTEYSTKDRQALKKLIIALGNKSRFQEAQNSLEAIEKNLQKARKNRESTEEDMEEAEAEWKFEAMCSGEAYYEDGKWKWRY